MTGPYRDGKMHVAEKKCSTCIYRPGNLFNLTPGAKEKLERENVMRDAAITCHKTYKEVTGKDEQVVCRGFWDVQRKNITALRFAVAIGIVEEVDADAD